MPISSAHFELREDGTIAVERRNEKRAPTLEFRDDARGLWIYHGNSLELLDAIAEKYPEGRFDCIFADPPYFLSNGGISCHAGRMVKVDKGDWDKSRGPELNHEFNLEWLKRCQKVLKPNGTIWITGTHHVIFSIGFAMQQLGYKILNDIAWEKPNPPPNLSCRYFTHSTETVLWAAKNEKSKHVFNYQEMRKVTGKQMKTAGCSPSCSGSGISNTASFGTLLCRLDVLACTSASDQNKDLASSLLAKNRRYIHHVDKCSDGGGEGGRLYPMIFTNYLPAAAGLAGPPVFRFLDFF